MSPLSSLFKLGTKVRANTTTARKIRKPVICVGNIVVGGTGKTPTCLAIADILTGMGKSVHFLAKGYRGKITAPTLVLPAQHTAADVGDEALLLAQKASTWVAENRAAGAEAASSGAEVVVMDDGLQNPGLEKNLNLVVIDGAYGFGNGRIMPAGPLRETIDQGMSKAHAVVLIGADEFNIETLVTIKYGLPVSKATYTLDELPRHITRKPVAAFAGIGRPEKFFKALKAAGIELLAEVAFPDHHVFSSDDLEKLKRIAKLQECLLVTTMKDYVRLPVDFRERVIPLPATLHFEDPAQVRKILAAAFTG